MNDLNKIVTFLPSFHSENVPDKLVQRLMEFSNELRDEFNREDYASNNVLRMFSNAFQCPVCYRLWDNTTMEGVRYHFNPFYVKVSKRGRQRQSAISLDIQHNNICKLCKPNAGHAEIERMTDAFKGLTPKQQEDTIAVIRQYASCNKQYENFYQILVTSLLTVALPYRAVMKQFAMTMREIGIA